MMPSSYEINFTEYRQDLVSLALSRLLSQFQGKPVISALIFAYMSEVQILYDAIIDLIEYRTLYNAQGENLNVLGRIVGQGRDIVSYDNTIFFAPDTEAQGTDQGRAWVTNAVFGNIAQADDYEYRDLIYLKTLRNSVRFSSTNEVTTYIKKATGISMSIIKDGPMSIKIYSSVPLNNFLIDLITKKIDTLEADSVYSVPYPATTNVSVIYGEYPAQTDLSHVESAVTS